VAMHDACAVNIELANPYWFYPQVNVKRQTCRHAQPIPTQPALFRCLDGRYVYYTLILSEQRAWESLVHWMDEMGMAANLTEAAYAGVAHRQQNMQEIQTLVECFFLVQNADTVFHEGQARGLPIGVLNAPEDLFHDEHLIARNFFRPVDHAGRSVPYPGPAICLSSAGHVPRRRAPLLGEHDAEILVRRSPNSAERPLEIAGNS
jgi:crotonobetainyl-CoA:carnitine CoA-transferase CaiB-like acyl-CoA transferase